VTPETDIVRSASEKIAIAFDLDEIAVQPTLESVRQFLVNQIITLLNTNPERLMAILYRIDVSEARVNEIFRTAIPPDMPELLADVILERQLAKAESRARYRDQSETDQ
jgi:hypothetical protein